MEIVFNLHSKLYSYFETLCDFKVWYLLILKRQCPSFHEISPNELLPWFGRYFSRIKLVSVEEEPLVK